METFLQVTCLWILIIAFIKVVLIPFVTFLFMKTPKENKKPKVGPFHIKRYF